MRYVAALCYALAIAAHSGALLNTLMLGALVFFGTVAVLFALEGIVKDAVRAPIRGVAVNRGKSPGGWRGRD